MTTGLTSGSVRFDQLIDERPTRFFQNFEQGQIRMEDGEILILDDTPGIDDNLANAYQSAGDLERAIPLFEQTLSDAERRAGKGSGLRPV